jgi:putative transposase
VTKWKKVDKTENKLDSQKERKMPGPKPTPIELSDEAKQALEKIVKGYKTAQQIALRAKIILAANAGKNNSQIKSELGIETNTVRLWRNRWQSLAALPLEVLSAGERLEDAPRAGAPARITAEQRCQIEQLACEKPEKAGVPISHWTNQEIATEIVRQGIVESISPRHAGRLLKRSRYKATSNSILANA